MGDGAAAGLSPQLWSVTDGASLEPKPCANLDGS